MSVKLVQGPKRDEKWFLLANGSGDEHSTLDQQGFCKGREFEIEY